MSQNAIVLISRNIKDYEFAQEVSKSLGIRFTQTETVARLHEVLCENLGTFILWDYDSVLEERPVDAKLNRDLIHYFEKHKAWNRVFAISSKPLRDSIIPGNFALFSKYIFRSFNPQTIPVYCHIIQNVLVPDPFEPHSVGANKVAVQKTSITNSARKKATIEALSIILEKKSVPKRVASTVIQALDELIMNAVFDAPVDDKKKHYKQVLDRGIEFELKKEEYVDIDLMVTDAFLQISVTDYFGSLERDDFVPLLAKNFQKQGVSQTGAAPKSDRGLGLYQILNSGLSMQSLIEPGKRTRMSLIIPWVANVRELKDSFRFFCLRVKT
jgi:hypothetical protein